MNQNNFNNSQRNDLTYYYINVKFSCSNGKSFLVCCKGDEKICEIIQKYRNKANDYDKNRNFLFNGRDLNNNNSSLIDNGINNGSLIKVIFQKEFNANN